MLAQTEISQSNASQMIPVWAYLCNLRLATVPCSLLLLLEPVAKRGAQHQARLRLLGSEMVQNSAEKRTTHENNSILCFFQQWLILAKLSLALVCGRADISFFTWPLYKTKSRAVILLPLLFFQISGDSLVGKKKKKKSMEICGLCKGANLNRKQFSRKFLAATWNYTKTFGIMSQSCFPAVLLMTWFMSFVCLTGRTLDWNIYFCSGYKSFLCPLSASPASRGSRKIRACV